ncbi:MAG: DUF4837 family protein [bacterium]
MMKLVKAVLWGGFVFLLVSGCFRKPVSFGSDTDLFVVADSSDWQFMESTLKDVFTKTIQTPQPESVFAVHWVPAQQFNDFATRKNLVILGALHSSGEMTKKINAMLTPEVRTRVESGQEYVFTKTDPWAKQQILLVLVSNSLEKLRDKMESNKKALYDILHQRLIEKTKREMFSELEQEDIELKLLRKYGWTVRVQHDYIVNIERPQDRFIMLRRSLPGRERWLFVHWIEDGDPEMIDADWAINTRNRLTGKFYENDRINADYTHTEEIEFLGRPALLTQGLWENVEKVAGGPFRNYCFYDLATERIYMIDIAVFYPAGPKEPFLRQLDIMAHSFKTSQETSEALIKKES